MNTVRSDFEFYILLDKKNVIIEVATFRIFQCEISIFTMYHQF